MHNAECIMKPMMVKR